MPQRLRLVRSDRSLVEALEPRKLLAADPILPDHPLWLIPRGSAVVDGSLSDADWQSAGEVFLTQATRDDRALWVRMMYNDQGVFLSAEVEDRNLWADGNGGGTGFQWELENDDSIIFYFDPDNSREEYFQAGDRAFGYNIASPGAPESGIGPVRRFKYVHGTGDGGAPGIAHVPGIVYATTVSGTINNPSDVDGGWTTEIFMPWAALSMAGPPVHGQTIGMNFDMIQDNSGGTRDLVDRRLMPERFTVPHFIDDHVQGAHSSYTATGAGVRGPVNYAEAMFIDPAAGQRPAAISGLTLSDTSPFGARLNFTSPAGTTGGLGHASGYQIRYSSAPIVTESDWLDAQEFANAYVPRLRGLAESLRIMELYPSTTYHVAIRAVDGAGNLGDLAASVSFTTAALPAPGYRGHLVPSPFGRALQFEDGTRFVPVGDHLGLPWLYTRTLYGGLMWDNANTQFIDFSDAPHRAAEPIGPFLADLAAHGVNTMRLYLELENAHVVGNPGPLPQGTLWFESNPGVYNPEMRQFVLNVLEQAAAHGIYLILSPFDTFSYDEAFGIEGPWAASRGGPLMDINEFFQTPGTLTIAKARMRALIDWVSDSPYEDHVLGYEFVSEWDSPEWTLQASDHNEQGRETEYRQRAIYMQELARFVHEEDPRHLTLNSTIARDPRGPIARLDSYSRNFDMLTPHLYTTGNEEPVNNPQMDRKVLPAREIGYFTTYWITNRLDRAPVLNAEWGMSRYAWVNQGFVPQYCDDFTQAEDEALFRTVLWSGFANGQVGTGLRIAADELLFRGMMLTDGMRDVQQTFSRFVNSQTLAIDFGRFAYDNLAGRVNARSPAGKRLHAWGISDGSQGIVYVLQDGNASTGLVADGVLRIRGLRPDQVMDAEVWSTGPGQTSAVGTISGVFVATGEYVLNLPAFSQDVVIKFKARPEVGEVQKLVSIAVGNELVTFAIGPDEQPTARIMNATTGIVRSQDISSLARFRGRAVDMTPYTTADDRVHLAVTDTNHHLWIFSGDIAAAGGAGSWTAIDQTAAIGAPGMTGDLTSYQPSWGAIHIAGVDARGHAINYWWAGQPTWQFSDLTELLNGPVFEKGLAGYVTGWDGLNLAGLNADGQVIVYWWAPGLSSWETLDMTAYAGGPKLEGQLDAFVTPWGGLNIAGTDAAGHVVTYWWAPGMETWLTADLTLVAGGPVIAAGTEVGISADGGINVYGLDAAGDLWSLRWTPLDQNWRSTNVSDLSAGPPPSFPLASSATGDRLLVASAGIARARNVVFFSFFIDSGMWEATTTDLLLMP
jgi:hypothetical protein